MSLELKFIFSIFCIFILFIKSLGNDPCFTGEYDVSPAFINDTHPEWVIRVGYVYSEQLSDNKTADEIKAMLKVSNFNKKNFLKAKVIKKHEKL